MTSRDKILHLSASPAYGELLSVSDEVLMQHIAGGHADALAVLFDRYHRVVMNIAMRILRDAGEAEDLMQSVFLEIFRSAAQFDAAKGTTKVWVLQYAYHRSFNRRQYLNLRGLYLDPAELTTTVSNEGAETHGSLSVFEAGRLVQQALARLGKGQRAILEMAFYEGLTMREIAAKTGDSFDSVRHHYYRGLEKLRCLLCDSPKAREGSSSAGKTAHVEP
jgi:RNA polymerase sigma-70 factor, ECF subfamily